MSRTSMVVVMLAFSIPSISYGSFTTGEGWDGPGLGSADLTWYVAAESKQFSFSDQFAIIEEALADWAAYADITFRYGNSAGAEDQLDFYFVDGVLDSTGFWGVGFLPDDVVEDPIVAGDIYIEDEALDWTTGTTSPANGTFDGVNYTSADVYFLIHHEIGHALGLQHPLGPDVSTNLEEGAVMSPFFATDSSGHPGFGAFDTLQTDDINGLRSLYSSDFTRQAAAVPEPSTLTVWSLLGLILVGFGRWLKTTVPARVDRSSRFQSPVGEQL